jgi:hypothetical protein
MSLPALYTLALEYRDAADTLADMELDEQTVSDTLEAMVGTLEQKATNVAMFVRNVEALAEQIKAAEKQMSDRRKGLEARAARVREYLKTNMELAGISEISCQYFKLAIRKNPPSVIIDDADQLPLDYVVLPPIPAPMPDKRKILDAIKHGETVPGASLDESKTRLEIR